jgi:ubiquinone/menaquinone biosynthesis C-methylase UbiE
VNRAAELLPAGAAFDAIAGDFDARFGQWQSVEAQRRAVRRALIDLFPEGSRLLEMGGGTGIDAAWLKARGREVLLTDASPAMVAEAARKLGPGAAQVIAIEQLGHLAERGERFDGAFSNFAALNCVSDLAPISGALARLVRAGGPVALVVFGCSCPGEMITEAVRGRFRNIQRRTGKGEVPAKLGGRSFSVRYYPKAAIMAAMAPEFRYIGRTAIGLFVPPSAAEPWISRHPRLLAGLEAADRIAAHRLALFGDHILYRFERRRDGRAT